MTPAQSREAALAAERRGDPTAAAEWFARAVRDGGNDAALLNSAGAFHARRGDHDAALELFVRALALAPHHPDATINRAIALVSLARPAEALTVLVEARDRLGGTARYWSVRGNAAREARRLRDAAEAYDHCLTIDPSHQRALHARARVALERGERGAPDRFDRALALSPQDAQLWLGKAQALEADGQVVEARTIAERIADQVPQWTDALEYLARLRWAAGDGDAFCAHYATAQTAQPNDEAVVLSWARMLAGAQRPHQAADVLAAAAPRMADPRTLRFAEAVYAGEAGDDRRATAIFATSDARTPDELAQLARHQLRIGAITAADATLAEVVRLAPLHVAGWALRDIAWRLLGDPRHDWLHGSAAFVSTVKLDISAEALASAITVLDALHAGSAIPVGQSVRAGTQTRGGLFDRDDAALEPLRAALNAAVATYREALPPRDPGHPLLAFRDQPWRIARSWSVRLDADGWHAEHIHPEGIVSSASYLRVPPPAADDPDAGALELGRPPADLRIDLPPLAVIRPRVGYLALFPSTLYHGTRRFHAGARMSVAVDVTPA